MFRRSGDCESVVVVREAGLCIGVGLIVVFPLLDSTLCELGLIVGALGD